MSNRDRSKVFTTYVGLELKGAIITHGRTAAEVAASIDRSPAVLNRWLNGRLALPLSVLYDVCSVIGADPQAIVQRAYERLRSEEEIESSRQQPRFDVSKLPPVVGREHLEGLRAVAEDQYTMPSEDDHTP